MDVQHACTCCAAMLPHIVNACGVDHYQLRDKHGCDAEAEPLVRHVCLTSMYTRLTTPLRCSRADAGGLGRRSKQSVAQSIAAQKQTASLLKVVLLLQQPLADQHPAGAAQCCSHCSRASWWWTRQSLAAPRLAKPTPGTKQSLPTWCRCSTRWQSNPGKDHDDTHTTEAWLPQLSPQSKP